jgi:hypothetical protein
MGTLTPGATYIYERADNVIYAREIGKTERTIVGYTNDKKDHTAMTEWNCIVRAAETNPALQEAVDRVKIIYNLSKQDGQ